MLTLALYIHWPFCAAKCPYCDFNSHVAETIDHKRWADAYEREIAYYAALTPGRVITSLFFGGGTPSLMKPEVVEHILWAAQKHWRMSNDVEITLEANPNSVEAEKFLGFRQAGVNRVSLGVQSFDVAALKFLGRLHSVREAIKALEISREIFGRFSFDLIYARPEQTLKDWRQELEIAKEYVGDHLSLYQLTIEPGTPFYSQHGRGEFRIPEEALAADFYETTQAVLGDIGLPAYEISNHARPGGESRHNMTYWRYGDYAGIGPGAHGRLTLAEGKVATRGHRAPGKWVDLVEALGQGGHEYEALEPSERVTEALMMGLRLHEGVPLSRLEREGGAPWPDFIDPKRRQALIDEGLLCDDADKIRATAAGVQRLNGVLRYLL